MKLEGIIIAIVFSLFALSCGGNAQNLVEGETAPDFTLENYEGEEFTLSDYQGQPVVVYFYPKAGTPGCTEEACGIRDNYSKFMEENIKVFGVSVDSKEELKDFKEENNLNFTLLSDADKTVSEKYGVLNNIGFSNRITFVINREGKIAHIMRDVDVSTHANEIYEIASKL